MMKLQEIRNKHPPGTSQKHLKTMKKYMDEGLSFQQAHNKAEATGAPAFPNQNKKLGYILNQDLMNKPGFAGAKHQFENQVLGMTGNQFDNQQKRLDKLSNQLDIITGHAVFHTLFLMGTAFYVMYVGSQT